MHQMLRTNKEGYQTHHLIQPLELLRNQGLTQPLGMSSTQQVQQLYDWHGACNNL